MKTDGEKQFEENDREDILVDSTSYRTGSKRQIQLI